MARFVADDPGHRRAAVHVDRFLEDGVDRAGHVAQVVAADDAVYVAAANAARCLGRNAAGAHGANAAAGAGFAEAAVRRLILDALLPGIRANFFAGFKQFVGRCFHLFNCD